MKRIAFLGCENTHADLFIDIIKNNSQYKDIEIVGVYSEDVSAADKLAEKYGVAVLENYSDAVGKVDGIVVTARHGDKHLKYALPYLTEGMVVFMDKPITIKQSEAVEFARICMKNGVKVTGGSSCRLDEWVQNLKRDAIENVGGETIGGYVRCPINLNNPNGGFFFYAQHLVEIVGEIFGRYPASVKSFLNGRKLTVVFRYKRYDIVGLFVDGSYGCYYAMRATENEIKGSSFAITSFNPCFRGEFDEFCKLLFGGEQTASFKELIAPVFVMNAIYKSIDSGKEEIVEEILL